MFLSIYKSLSCSSYVLITTLTVTTLVYICAAAVSSHRHRKGQIIHVVAKHSVRLLELLDFKAMESEA